MKIERCCLCSEPTERAGRHDDSIYLAGGTPAEIGPLCETCRNTILDDNDDLVNLRTQLTEAQETISKMESALLVAEVTEDSLNLRLTEAQNARADTLAENVKLNDALGQIHILCADAGIDPGNVVDRVRELADKAQALDRLEEMKGNAKWIASFAITPPTCAICGEDHQPSLNVCADFVRDLRAKLTEAQAKAQALDRLEEIAAKYHRTMVIFSVGGKAIIDLNAPCSNYPQLRQEFSTESITAAWEASHDSRS